jgi:hypothetical protein
LTVSEDKFSNLSKIDTKVSDLLKPMKSNHHSKLLAILCIAPSMAIAQDVWQLDSSVTVMTGHYADSLIMNNQHGLGLRMTGEKDQKWGFTAGLQSTRIDMAPLSSQDQYNWLLSGFLHIPTNKLPGRLTVQLDTHQVQNDAPQSSNSNVLAIATQATWLSYTQPLKVDFSFASSAYKNTAAIHQLSAAFAYGFNDAKDWLQVRGYAIDHLTASTALGQSSTRATDLKLTHFFSGHVKWAPAAVTLGIERGKRIYVVDMTTQTLYNLPMLNQGAENIAANWKLSPKTDLNLQFSKTRYFADIPYAPSAHRFTLSTLSAQLATSW